MRELLIVVGIAAVATAALAQTSRAPETEAVEAVCHAVAEGRAELIDVPVGYQGNEDPETVSVDLDNDGTPEEVAILYGGTSRTPALQANGEFVDSRYENGLYDFMPWAGQLTLVRHGGRVYEVFYSDGASLDFPVYLAIHLPSGESRWVCAFQSNGPAPHLAAVNGRADAAPICAAVEGRLSDGATDFAFAEVEHRGGRLRESYVRSEGAVDFMNDGAPRRLAYAEYSSGAGAGCGAYFYQFADHDTASRSEANALELLQSYEVGERYPARLANGWVPCSRNTARFHRISGSVVFEQRFPGERPLRANQQFWWVSRVENGEAVRICEATSFDPRPRTIRYNPEFYPPAD